MMPYFYSKIHIMRFKSAKIMQLSDGRSLVRVHLLFADYQYFVTKTILYI